MLEAFILNNGGTVSLWFVEHIGYDVQVVCHFWTHHFIWQINRFIWLFCGGPLRIMAGRAREKWQEMLVFTVKPLQVWKLLKSAGNILPVSSSDGAIILQLRDTWESLWSTRSAVQRVWPAHMDLAGAAHRRRRSQIAALGGHNHTTVLCCSPRVKRDIFSHMQ